MYRTLDTRSGRRRAIPWASFDGRGYAKRNRDALYTTSNKYSFPVSDVLEIFSKANSRTYHSLRYLPSRQHNYTLVSRALPSPTPARQDILPRVSTHPWPMEAVAQQ